MHTSAALYQETVLTCGTDKQGTKCVLYIDLIVYQMPLVSCFVAWLLSPCTLHPFLMTLNVALLHISNEKKSHYSF